MKHLPLIVVGGVIEKEGKFLLVQLAEYKGVDGLKWTIPAGKWDREESILEGAKREVREETGYDFEPTSILGFYSRLREWPDLVHNTIRVIYRGKISGEQNDLEHDIVETKWFTAEEIFAMDQDTIRFMEIKDMIRDYHSGREYPLETIQFFGKI